MTMTPFSSQNEFLSTFVVATLAAVLILFGATGTAFSSDEPELRIREVSARSNHRAEGLGYFELPMRIRARFNISFKRHVYASDALARPYVTKAGPGLKADESLQSQFALTRELSDRVEIGIVWGARSPVSRIDLFDFERQTVGAMIRITP